MNHEVRSARKEDGKDRAMGELSGQAAKRMNEMKSAQAANDPKQQHAIPIQGASVRRWVRFQSWISPWAEVAASHWRSGENASW